MTTGKKIAAGFAAALLLMVIVGTITYVNTAKLVATSEMVTDTHAVIAGLSGLLSKLQDAETGQRGYLLTGIDRYLEPYNTAIQTVETDIKELRELTSDKRNQQLRIDTLDLLVKDKLAELQQTIELRKGDGSVDDQAAFQAALEVVKTDRGKELMDEIRNVIAEMEKEESNLLQQRDEEADKAAQTTILAVVIGTLVVLVLVITISIFIIRGLAQSLSRLSVATGQVAAAATEIAAVSQQQVSNLTQSATSLNQMAATSEEFKSSIQEFTDRARSVLEAAEETARQAAEGIGLTKQSAAKSEAVRSQAQTAGESVLSLVEHMQRIGEITAAVNEIAEQTKLLALNASIEAARAGEEGRGFAVVATQVRELANQSKEAAVRIDSLIGETQKSTQAVVSRIEEGSHLSDETAELAVTTGARFQRIADSIEQTAEAVKQIADGAQQQEEGIFELAQGMTEVNTGAKQTLANAEQAQRSIVAIDRQIKSLNEGIAKL
jgi:methyl-accepting chemotaxis protein